MKPLKADGVVVDVGAQAGAGSIQDFAHFTINELMFRSKLGCLPIMAFYGVERLVFLREPRTADALRVGRTRGADHWAILRALGGFFWLGLMLALYVMLDILPELYFKELDPDILTLADLSYIYRFSACYAIALLGLYGLGYASIRARRRKLAAGLQRQDLLARVYAGDDPLVPVRRAIWPPLRFWCFPRWPLEPGGRARLIADNLDWCVQERGPYRRWEDLLGHAWLMLPLCMFLVTMLTMARILRLDLPGWYPITQFLDNPTNTQLISIILLLWWGYFIALRSHRFVIGREHWMLDIYDRHLARSRATQPGAEEA